MQRPTVVVSYSILLPLLSVLMIRTAHAAHFPDPSPSSAFVTVSLTATVGGSPLAVDDEVVVYSVHPRPGVPNKWERTLVGHAVAAGAGPMAVTVYGDDTGTAGVVEGAVPGEELCLVLWRSAENMEYTAYTTPAGLPITVAWTSDGDSLTVDLDFREGQRIPLRTGAWNLVSYGILSGYYRGPSPPGPPVAGPQLTGVAWNSVATLGDAFPLKSIEGKVDRVVGNDGKGNKLWISSIPASTLAYLAPGYGYWVRMKAGSTPLSWMTVPGSRATLSETLPLSAGWTLLGYWDTGRVYHASTYDASWELVPVDASPAPLATLGEVWGSLGSSYDRMSSFDGGGNKLYLPSLPGPSTMKYLAPGYGYWGKMSGSVALGYSPPDPRRPTGVTAIPGVSQVTVSWNPVSGATSYNLYWSTTPGVSKTTGTQIAGVTSPFLHDNIVAGTPHHYVVTAVVGGGEGPESYPASATPTAAPAVNTLAPTSVADNSATLNGNVTANGSATTAWFEWGTSPTLATYDNTPLQAVGSGAASVGVTAPLSALLPGTTYSYRVAASNAAGTLRGEILSFTTNDPAQIAPDMSAVPVSMTYEERRAALDNVAAFWTASTTTDLDADNFALANYIRNHPAFADAGVSPDRTVWGRFRDGEPVVWLTEQRVGIPAAPALSPGTSALRAAPVSAPRPMTGEIPQGSKAVMIDMGGTGAGGPAKGNDWLNRPETGYSSVLLGGSLEDLETKIKDVAVLYISSHGGFGVGRNGKATYMLATGSEILSFVQTRERMAQDGYLIRGERKNADGTVYAFWAITESFVDNNWTFTPDSLIVIDACSLFYTAPALPGYALLGERFRSKLAKKSATLVGWDGVVGVPFASGAMKLFFDRVLGANDYQPEIPPQRPFPYTQVYDWMAAKGKVTEPGTDPATMKLEQRGTAYGQLVPSVSGGEPSYSAGNWELYLYGSFGPDTGEGTVTVGNILLPHPPVFWSDEMIIASMPPPGQAGSYGDVVVEVRGHKSNVVPITRWTGTVKQVQTEIGGGGRAEFSCPVLMTSDVHFNRLNPGENPWLCGGNAGCNVLANVQVTAPCNYTFSGEWDMAGCRITLSGSGTFDLTGWNDAHAWMQSSGYPLIDDILAYFDVFSGTMQTFSGPYTAACPEGSTAGFMRIDWAFTPVGNRFSPPTLGADYSLKSTRNCQEGPYPGATCKETWDLTPSLFTAPTPETQR